MAVLNAVLLAVVAGALTGYWLFVLGPFIERGETSRAELLVSAHTAIIETALESGDLSRVQATLDQMVLLNDVQTGQPFVRHAELAAGNGERLRAQSSAHATNEDRPVEAMVFSVSTFDQVGVLTVVYSGVFYEQARADAIRGLALAVIVPMVLLAIGNMTTGYLLQARIDRASRREQESAARYAAELEARVQERTAQLATANAELEAFSYSVSHDLRAPLRAIDGYSRMLVEDHADRLADDARRMIGAVRSETQRMGRLIYDLLAFSRAQRAAMEPSDIDMTALAGAARDEALAAEPGRDVQITLRPLAPARGAPTMIRQVWANLLANAVKFTRGREHAAIEIGSSPGVREQIYYVKDNGAGFDGRFAGKLFGVFQRLHPENEFEGTGIGLALVQRIVTRHGGRVWAEGEVGAGATFYFTLPERKEVQS